MGQRQNTFRTNLGIMIMNWKEKMAGLLFCLTLLGIMMWGIFATQGMAGVTGTASPGSGANVKHPGEIVAKQKNCLACHNVNVKMVGPALKDVAKKYSEADKEYLVGKVMQGSMGVWGQIPMPPNNVTAEEAGKAIDWILSLK